MISGLYYWVLFRLSPKNDVDGLDVRCWFAEGDERGASVAKVQAALRLLATHSLAHLELVRRDLAGIFVIRIAALAQYQTTRLCLLDTDALVTRDMDPAVLASVLVHEATHARLHRLGIRAGSLSERARHERVCLKAQRLAATRLPDSRPTVEAIDIALEWPATIYSAGEYTRQLADRLREVGVPPWLVRALTFGRRRPSNVELKPTATPSSLVE